MDGRAYLWAALFGPFYVLLNGFPLLALLMVPVSAAIFVSAFFGFGLLDWVLGSEVVTVGALLVMPIAAFVIQGMIAVEFVRRGYLHAGWREGY
ncbi:MAG: hypothetical protein HYZ40_07000 [Rhodospirillales bacterium]|nr:hypothetical protein [Rhodospirillales bacterium]